VVPPSPPQEERGWGEEAVLVHLSSSNPAVLEKILFSFISVAEILKVPAPPSPPQEERAGERRPF
jgi:hypothetical protein